MTALSIAPQAPADLLQLLTKQGVRLGLLGEAERRLALALVWSGLADDMACSEPQINAALKARMAGAAAFLDIDHVELRRWLVDGGWLLRDGFGRVYRKAAAAALVEAFQPVAQALAGLDLDALASGLRQRAASEKAAKRLAWEQRQAAA